MRDQQQQLPPPSPGLVVGILCILLGGLLMLTARVLRALGLGD